MMFNHFKTMSTKPDCSKCIYCEYIKGSSIYPKGWFCFLRNMAADDMEKYHVNTRRCLKARTAKNLKVFEEMFPGLAVHDDDPSIADE